MPADIVHVAISAALVYVMTGEEQSARLLLLISSKSRILDDKQKLNIQQVDCDALTERLVFAADVPELNTDDVFTERNPLIGRLRCHVT